MAGRRAGICKRVLQTKQLRQEEKTGKTPVPADAKQGQVYLHKRKKPMLFLFKSMGIAIEEQLDAGTYELKMSFKES